MLQTHNPTSVDLLAKINKLDLSMGNPKYRAAHGQWIPYAWVVRGLVERGHGVTDSVNIVIEQAKLTPPDLAFRSLRAAYYKIKPKPWPKEIVEKEPGYEDFEV